MRHRRRSRRNPFNQPKPAEWATMSKASRKAWNRKHWRPHEYMVVVPLKRYATRKANQRARGQRGGGLEDLAAKIERMRSAERASEQTNPRRRGRRNPNHISGWGSSVHYTDLRAQKVQKPLRGVSEPDMAWLRVTMHVIARNGTYNHARLAEIERDSGMTKHQLLAHFGFGGHLNPPSYRKLRHKAHRAERKRYRRDQRRIEREETYGNLLRRHNPSTRSKVERELVYAIGDWLTAEQEQGQKRFYERMDSSPRNRLLMKTVWTLAHQLGITTRPQLDAFKAKHAKQLAPLLA